jgi:hypothetical protein
MMWELAHGCPVYVEQCASRLAVSDVFVYMHSVVNTFLQLLLLSSAYLSHSADVSLYWLTSHTAATLTRACSCSGRARCTCIDVKCTIG